ALKGDIAIPDFQTDAKSQPQEFAVKNDLIAENFSAATSGATRNLNINTLSVSMPQSKALGLSIANAKLLDIDHQRQFQNFAVNVTYDLAQLWPIVKPMLSPETQQKYADLKIAGQFKRDLHLGGAYPADLPFNQA